MKERDQQGGGVSPANAAHFRKLAEAMPQLVWTANEQGVVDYYNGRINDYDPAVRLSGNGFDWSLFLHPDDLAATVAAWRGAQETGVYTFEHRLRMADGSWRWHLSRALLDQDEENGVKWYGTATDIDDRKRAEEALRRSEARYRTLFETMDEGFCVIEMIFDDQGQPFDYRFLETNPAFEHFTGLQAATGKTARQLVPNLEQHWFDIYGQITLTGQARRFEDGSTAMGRWFDVYAFPIGLPAEHRVAILFTNITERKRIEERLLQSEERFRLTFEQAPVGIGQVTPTGELERVNPAFCRILGYSETELIGRTVGELNGVEEQQPTIPPAAPLETRYRRKDGTLLWANHTNSVVSNSQGQVLFSIAILEDINERKAAEAALRRSEEQLRALFDYASDAIFIADDRGVYQAVNDAACVLSGYSRDQLLGKTIYDLTPPGDYTRLAEDRQRLLAGQSQIEEWHLLRQDGATVPIEVSIKQLPDGRWQAFVRDITERKQSQERLHFLAQASALLASSLDYAQTLENVARTAVPGIADWCVIDLLAEDGSFQQGIVAHVDPAKVHWAEELRARYPIDPNGLAGAPHVIRTGQAEIYPDISDAVLQAVAKNSEELALLRAVGYRSVMVVPLITHGRTLGAITFVTTESARCFTDADMTMAEEVARRAAAAIGNAQLHQAMRQREQQLQASEAEIQRLNRTLRQRLDELQTLLDVAPIGIFVAQDPTCTVITGNPAGARMLRLESDKNASKSSPNADQLPFRVLRNGRELTAAEMPMQYAVMNDTPILNWDVDIVFADNSVVNLYEYAMPLHDEEGRVRGGLGIFIDITERKQAEEFLRSSEERFRSAFDQAAVGMAHLALDGRYLRVNDRLCAILGYSRQELLEKTFMDITHPDDLSADLRQMERQLAGEVVHHSMEKRYIRKDGSILWATMTAAVVRNAAGVPQYGAVVIEDISARKAAEAELHQLNATLEQRVAERTRELERTVRALDQFAYVASHDLKAPLRAINNLAQWITEDAAAVLPSASQAHLTKLCGRVQRMEKLLDDLLTFSRAGRIRTHPEQVDTGVLVREIWELLGPPPGFTLSQTDSLPVLRTERVALETILRNLIGNALKHHHRPDGKITVRALEYPQYMEFTVSDDGPGIEPQYHQKIFEMFQTLKPRDQVEGSGMGLAVVKKLVESYDGTVWVESASGQGTTFHFTWPKMAPPQQQAVLVATVKP